MKLKILSLAAALLFTMPIYAAKIRGSRTGANAKSAGFFVEAYSTKGRVLFKSIKFDEQGNFELDFPANEALVYWIDNFPVYMQANDEVSLILPERKNAVFVLGGPPAGGQEAKTSKPADPEIHQTGETSLNHLLINDINQVWASLITQQSNGLKLAAIDLKYAEASKLLTKSKDVSLKSAAEFYNNLRYLEAKLQYIRANPTVHFDQSYYAVLNKLSLNDPAVNSLKPIGIRALAANYYQFLRLSEGAAINDEEIKDNTSIPRMQYLLKNVSNPRIINEELSQSIIYHLSATGWSPELDKVMAAAAEKITDPEVNKNLAKLRADYSKVSKNAKAPDFSIPDAAGKLVNLSDFKGKIVAIDVWATWCVPCMHSLPYFLNLRQKYKDNPNLVFLSVSIDNEASKDKWLSFLKSKNMNGVDLHAGDKQSSDFQKAYNITGIPRYILINREGKIIEDHAVQASEPAYVTLLEDALKSK